MPSCGIVTALHIMAGLFNTPYYRIPYYIHRVSHFSPPFCPHNSLKSSGSGTLQGVESLPQGFWPMLTPMLPTVVSSWLDVLWLVDHSWYTKGNCWEWKTQQRCSSWHKPVFLTPTTVPCSKAPQYFVFSIHPLNVTHTQSMSQFVSRLKNPSLTRLLPFIYTDLKWI